MKTARIFRVVFLRTGFRGATTLVVVDVDTIMNQKFFRTWTAFDQNNLCAYGSTYDAQEILTHELGHWMGLNDEYDPAYLENTMYGFGGKGEIKKAVKLTIRIIFAIL
jgi:hypothetical protein